MTTNPVQNPYASPAIPGFAAENQPREIKHASQGKRFLNLIVDTILLQIIVQVTGFMIGLAYGVSKVAPGGTITPADTQMLQIIGALWGISVMLGYYVLMEYVFQRTVAKFLTGTVVVAKDGRRPTFQQILGRSFARLIPFEAFSFFGTPTVGWHDSLSGTLVVSAK